MSYPTLGAPHIHSGESVAGQMYKVLFALTPALMLGLLQFGLPAIELTFVCVVSALLSEFVSQRLQRQPVGAVADGSALLTAVLLAMSLPPHAPLWLGALGGLFAVALGKQAYGGLGQNLFNPAMLARVVLLISFPVEMTQWPEPSAFYNGVFALLPDGATGATMLGHSHNELPWTAPFLGLTGGSLGETSALAILLGGLWLIWKRVIHWTIPLAVLTGALVPAVLCYFFVADAPAPMTHLLSGGLMLGAFFIATDPVTSPNSALGQWIYGLGIGLLVLVIRQFGSLPEGVAFAVLLMNGMTPLIDRGLRPQRYGIAVKETRHE